MTRRIERLVRRVVSGIRLMVSGDPEQRAVKAAIAQAKRDVTDATAAEALSEDVRGISTAVLDRALSQWGERRDYLDDRAYRLLLSAHQGGPVTPIPAKRRDEFEMEGTLGRLPIADAFAGLVEVEPALSTLEEAAVAREKIDGQKLRSLLGPDAQRSQPVLKGRIALEIAEIHLRDRARGRRGYIDSYFDRVSSIRVNVGFTPTSLPIIFG